MSETPDGQCALCGLDTEWIILGGHLACIHWEDRPDPGAEPELDAEAVCPCGETLTGAETGEHSMCPVLVSLFDGTSIVDPYTLGDEIIGTMPAPGGTLGESSGASSEAENGSSGGTWGHLRYPRYPLDTPRYPLDRADDLGESESGSLEGLARCELPDSAPEGTPAHIPAFDAVTLRKVYTAVEAAGGRLALTAAEWAARLGRGSNPQTIGRVLREICRYAPSLVCVTRKSHGRRIIEVVQAWSPAVAARLDIPEARS